jgi:prepilin signal peptidase PulO-like enzyme (type II secretory pathway)
MRADILTVMERDSTWTLRCVDYVSATLAGGVAAGVVSLLIPSDWPGLMGMILGMVFALVVCMGFSLLAGPFGILMPGMTAGMIAGMVCGMRMTGEAPLEEALAAGALIGLGTAVVFHLYDRSLHGEVLQDDTGSEA